MKKKNNKIYYHYCSVDTFYNILQTGTIQIWKSIKYERLG